MKNSKSMEGQFSPGEDLSPEKAKKATERVQTHRKLENQLEEQTQSEVEKIKGLTPQYEQSLEDMREVTGDDRVNLREKLVKELNTHLDGIMYVDNEEVKNAKTKLESIRDQINSL